ncbi:DUF5677 domain-containing protein [Leucobacter allii]|uniref:DUF5677 domain-containing protein n=1 Tax=Leucobacter allii TaxID=2932247 RepID=A0ABY4FR58_9MICO|nr:DUF5677 domain-containing protein [Leucobacter allii]UOQ58772.1 DUF5677 domain-containing protein [Leucobacter allii]
MPTLTEESDLRALVAELGETWLDFDGSQSLHQPAARRGKRFLGSDLARMTAVWGLTCHVYETSRAIALLVDNHMPNQAIPLVRFAYESALTAAWLVQSKDQHGITAFLHEYNRTRAALKKDAFEAVSATFRDVAPEITDADPSEFEGSADSVQRFRGICLDLTPGGMDAYIYYRILSSYSHASVNISDLYFQRSDSSDGVPNYVGQQESLGAPLLLFLTAASMVWAGRAFTYMTQDKHHRTRIRKAAQLLGINSELQLSEHYRRRHLNKATRRSSNQSPRTAPEK